MFFTQRHQLFERKKSKYFCFISFSVPEVKILIISCYFIFFGILALISFSLTIRDADAKLEKLLDYFVCHSVGYNANHTCHAEYDAMESIAKPELNSATYFLLGLLPWTNLLFAIQVSDIKNALQKVLYFYSHDSQNKALSTSST